MKDLRKFQITKLVCNLCDSDIEINDTGYYYFNCDCFENHNWSVKDIKIVISNPDLIGFTISEPRCETCGTELDENQSTGVWYQDCDCDISDENEIIIDISSE